MEALPGTRDNPASDWKWIRNLLSFLRNTHPWSTYSIDRVLSPSFISSIYGLPWLGYRMPKIFDSWCCVFTTTFKTGRKVIDFGLGVGIIGPLFVPVFKLCCSSSVCFPITLPSVFWIWPTVDMADLGFRILDFLSSVMEHSPALCPKTLRNLDLMKGHSSLKWPFLLHT